MPRNITNKDVAAYQKPRLGVKVSNANPTGGTPYSEVPAEVGDPDAILAEAKQFLAQAPDLSEIARIPASLNALRAAQDEAAPYSGREWARGLTEGTDAASMAAGVASMAPTPASPLLAGASMGLGALGGLRKLISPDADESRLEGGLQTALMVAPGAVGKGLSVLRKNRAIPVPPGLGMAESTHAGPFMRPSQAPFEPYVPPAGAWKGAQPAGRNLHPETAARSGVDPRDFEGVRTVPGSWDEVEAGGLASITQAGPLDRLKQATVENDLLDDFISSETTRQQLPYDWKEAGGRFIKNAEGSDTLEQLPEAWRPFAGDPASEVQIPLGDGGARARRLRALGRAMRSNSPLPEEF